MTDNVGDPVSSEKHSVGRLQSVVEWYERPDPTLQDLVSIANIGPGLGVTLYLPWGAASGYVLSSHAFYSAAAAWIRSTDDHEAEGLDEDAAAEKRKLSNTIASFAFDEGARPVDESERKRGVRHGNFDLTTHIHMSDVYMFMAGYDRPVLHKFLRLRLNSITAWTWGQIRPPSDVS